MHTLRLHSHAASVKSRMLRNPLSASLGRPSIAELRRVHAFSTLADSTLASIAAHVTWRRTRAGETVNICRDSGPLALFSLTARFRITLLAKTGVVCVVRRVAPGEDFGDVFAAGAPAAHCLAERDGDYIEIEAGALEALANQLPDLCMALWRSTASLAAAQSERIFELCTLTLRHRLRAEILRLAAEGRPREGHILISPSPTHEVFASLLGGTREAVTRELKVLVEQGFIRVGRKEITVVNLERMRAAAARASAFA